MNLDKYTVNAQEALTNAQQMVINLGQQHLEPEHVLSALLEDPEGLVSTVLKKAGVDPQSIKIPLNRAIDKFPKVYGTPGQVYASPNFNQMVSNANNEGQELKDEYVSTEHLLLAILDIKRCEASRILNAAGLKRDQILKVLMEIRGNQRVTDQNPEGK
jgi:ATP-dependent Clp protease ATP-binding subunit ClpB